MSECESMEFTFEFPKNNATMPLVDHAIMIVKYYPATSTREHRFEVLAFYFDNEALTDVPTFSRAEFLSRIYNTILELCEAHSNPEFKDYNDEYNDIPAEFNSEENCDGLSMGKNINDTGYYLDNLVSDDDDIW